MLRINSVSAAPRGIINRFFRLYRAHPASDILVRHGQSAKGHPSSLCMKEEGCLSPSRSAARHGKIFLLQEHQAVSSIAWLFPCAFKRRDRPVAVINRNFLSASAARSIYRNKIIFGVPMGVEGPYNVPVSNRDQYRSLRMYRH